MTEYEALKKQDELIRNDDSISNYDLVMYQRKMAKYYPYFPLKEKDWNKIQLEAITKKGLEQLEILRIQITMGKASSEDIVIYMRLFEMYVCSNPSLNHARQYKKELLSFRYQLDPSYFFKSPALSLIFLHSCNGSVCVF